MGAGERTAAAVAAEQTDMKRVTDAAAGATRPPKWLTVGGSAVFTYSCRMPAKSDPADIGDVEPLTDSTAQQARRVVAAYANDADECRIFLSMLGIGPAKNES